LAERRSQMAAVLPEYLYSTARILCPHHSVVLAAIPA